MHFTKRAALGFYMPGKKGQCEADLIIERQRNLATLVNDKGLAAGQQAACA